VLGYASVPLATVLLTARKPMAMALPIVRPTGYFQAFGDPKIEVTLVDEVNDIVEWVKVSDAIHPPDESNDVLIE
jgi:hypothetical protein